MKPRLNSGTNCFFDNEKAKTIFWNLSSEAIGVYLWFLKFSNVLLKLIQ